MKNICFIFCLFLFSQTVVAQGVINITQDPAIEAAINKHIAMNKANTKQNGWCIQLMASNNRDKVMNMKSRFIQSHPGVLIDWDYERPFFKLKAGAFKTKLEALSLLTKVKGQYPGAYVTRGKFHPKEFIK